jgi:hypothetical protein
MKRRELRGIAKAIAQNEKIIADKNATADEIKVAMQNIKDLSTRFESLEDMLAVDEMVQDLMR